MTGRGVAAVVLLVCAGGALLYALGAGLGVAALALVRRLVGRGEESGVPEEPVPVVPLNEARAAIDAVLVDAGQVNRRLERMAAAEELKGLRRLPRQLEGFYVQEVDR